MSDDVWWVDEGMAGQGPRPDYLQPKYKSLAEQAKAYNEARKSLAAMTGAPDSYALDDFKDHIDIESPPLQEFLKYAREQRFNQEAVATTVKHIIDYEKRKVPDENEEMAKLGTDGPKKRGIVDQWAKNTLSKESQDAYEALPKTADVIKFMDELRQKSIASMSNPPAANGASTQNFKPMNEAEIRQEMRDNYEKYQNSPQYREEIRRKLEQVLGVN